MGVTGRIEYTRSPGTLLKTLRSGVRPVMVKIGKHWHDDLLDKHFTPSGAREYGYQERTARYKKRKMKQKGHRRPLVYSGDLMRAVKRAYALATTTKSVKVKMKGPKYLHYSNAKHATPINKADELTRVSQKEVNAIAIRFRDGIAGKMNTTRKHETRVIR